MPDEIRPAYLLAGSDERKISTALARLRVRAEREGGAGALESIAPASVGGAPDAAALIAAIPALSLVATHRYLLAEDVDRWSASQVKQVAATLAELPPDLTVVLVARAKPPPALVKAVESAGGEVLSYEAPRARDLPGWLAVEARERGFALEREAARLLVDRIGSSTVRLSNELDRLALWVEEGGTVTADDLAAMVADTSEEVAWALSDAIVRRRPGDALLAAERLAGQGESLTGLVYSVASRLRKAHRAVAELEAGRSPKEIEGSLGMHPYAAKILVREVRNASAPEIRGATCAIADLEYWTRGGSDYGDDVALALGVMRAAGGASAG